MLINDTTERSASAILKSLIAKGIVASDQVGDVINQTPDPRLKTAVTEQSSWLAGIRSIEPTDTSAGGKSPQQILDDLHATSNKVLVSTMPQKVVNELNRIRFMVEMQAKNKPDDEKIAHFIHTTNQGSCKELETAITESFGVNSNPSDFNLFIEILSKVEPVDPIKLISKDLSIDLLTAKSIKF